MQCINLETKRSDGTSQYSLSFWTNLSVLRPGSSRHTGTWWCMTAITARAFYHFNFDPSHLQLWISISSAGALLQAFRDHRSIKGSPSLPPPPPSASTSDRAPASLCRQLRLPRIARPLANSSQSRPTTNHSTHPRRRRRINTCLLCCAS